MPAVHGDPPAVARQRVRRALRKARERTPFSQGEVAKKLGWSLSKMQRIEGGEVAVSPTDLRALLDVYGVTDGVEVERLVADTRTARRQRYETAPEYREHLTPALLELVQYEQKAEAIRNYQPVFYPGVLQTPAVAESILDFWRDHLSADQRRVRFEIRMARRARLFDGHDGPDLYLLLDESVIKRTVRDARITAEQLESIVAVARLPRVRLRLVGLTVGAYTSGLGPFELLTLSDEEGGQYLYRERALRDELINDPAEVKLHRREFDMLWGASRSEESSLNAIAAEALRLRSELAD